MSGVTHSFVSSGTESVTLLNANSGRNGAVIHNTDTNALLIDVTGGTAASGRHHYRIVQHGTVEVPYDYTGAITGVWEGDGTGGAVIAEFI